MMLGRDIHISQFLDVSTKEEFSSEKSKVFSVYEQLFHIGILFISSSV